MKDILYIQGDDNRGGDEIIQALEALGGKNVNAYDGKISKMHVSYLSR